MAVRIGASYSNYGLQEVDCCWLLRMGQIICSGKTLPSVDPLSYCYPTPVICYQWLAEVIFFCLNSLLTTTGLLAACALIASIALLVLPLRALVKAHLPPYFYFPALAHADNCQLQPLQRAT